MVNLGRLGDLALVPLKALIQMGIPGPLEAGRQTLPEEQTGRVGPVGQADQGVQAQTFHSAPTRTAQPIQVLESKRWIRRCQHSNSEKRGNLERVKEGL